MKKFKGIFITFEGSEGSGKSTQIEKLRRYLRTKKRKAVFVREPGGAKVSEAVRKILLDPKNKAMSPECDTMLYMAARAQLVAEVIEPALKQGRVVLCDRFLDSTAAYQGYGSGVSLDLIERVGKFVTRNITPDLTFFFDIDAKTGLDRIKRERDRIEQRKIDYHKRVRRGYLALARKHPRRIKMIDGQRDRDAIQRDIRAYVDKKLGIRS